MSVCYAPPLYSLQREEPTPALAKELYLEVLALEVPASIPELLAKGPWRPLFMAGSQVPSFSISAKGLPIEALTPIELHGVDGDRRLPQKHLGESGPW